ncbi:maleylpyruvate isomerase family mycothiol-dependent enzyme [Nonomuraea africana]|uniref:Maleylpyruvate isomerase n=1 Tax=Nonomuraea africana TaxID=46171 RepID=A0ABR9KFS2_9ACTN|nr:maleylpyruvate isomerase family mycothiol-dependent enzyme [Nonomuraea africana]MBE1560834.1 maleylpyruvate isomerase [Nonomuraea africana]
MTVLPSLRAELAAATERLLSTAAELDDAGVTAPSLLPGWTRGHVLTHLARNADGLVNLLTWARTGIETPQYPDPAARAAGIEAGAARKAAEQRADLEESAARLAATIEELPAQAWSAMVSALRPPPHPAWYVLVRRLRELELHHVDLGAGYTPANWPEAFVLRELHDCLACWPYGSGTVSAILLERPAREWHGLGEGPVVRGGSREVLAWLTGRSAGEGIRVVSEGPRATGEQLPSPPPWLTMPAPANLPTAPPDIYPEESP